MLVVCTTSHRPLNFLSRHLDGRRSVVDTAGRRQRVRLPSTGRPRRATCHQVLLGRWLSHVQDEVEGEDLMAKKKRPRRLGRCYTLEVSIIGGRMTESFVKRNPVCSRTIEILGKQTLADLHEAIFEAFDRWDEHMYEFQFGEQPHDPDAVRYGLEMGSPFADVDESTDVRKSPLDSLDLEAEDSFFYWFDFGDDWWHQIDVVAIDEDAKVGKYPRVTERIGKSPPQYPDNE